MTPAGRFEHLRHAALDMLDAGNSMAAVSQLLAVPAPVIARWREEPVPPRAQPAPVARQKDGPGRALKFPKTLVVRRGLRYAWMYQPAIRYAVTALAVVLLALTLHSRAPGELLIEADITASCACVWWWFQHGRPLFTLTSDAIVVPSVLGSARMPYADLVDWWLVMHVKVLNYRGREYPIDGRLLTLFSRRAGVRPIEVFVNEYVDITPEVTERLDLVKTANIGPGPLTRPRP